MARALTAFTAAGVIAMLVLAGAATLVLRRAGAAEALHEARVVTQVQEQAVRPHVTDALVAGDHSAFVDFDKAVRLMVMSGRVERVKLWSADGTVLYADDARLIGQRFSLGPDELAVLRTGLPASDVSDLSAPENRFESGGHQLLEVYQRTQTPDGTPLLFETYLRYDGVIAAGHRIWTDFAPALLVTLLALEVLQLPLAWRLMRRLQQGQRERDVLHRRAVEASDAERQRIAGDLHDGVVQTLAGVSYSLGAAAVGIRGGDSAEVRAVQSTISVAAELTRRSIRELRSLLVDIYPPNLRDAGLHAALADLLAPLGQDGLRTDLMVDERCDLAPQVEQLLYRAAQEAVRNVVKHAQAGLVEVQVSVVGEVAQLRVRDDGRGFTPAATADQVSHFGLRLLREMSGRLDGRLYVDSVPGVGTSLCLEVPAT